MPLPEGYLPRKGDVLVLHGRVAYDVDESDLLKRGDADEYQVFVRLEGDHSDRRVPLKTVIDVFSKTWDAGDRVVIDGDDEGGSGEVIAVHENLCWIKYDRPGRETSYGTYPANVLNAASKDPIDEPFVEEPPSPPPGPMRFVVPQAVIIARLPEDPLRAEEIAPYIGRSATIYEVDDRLYKVNVAGNDFYVSDDMLDPAPAPSTIEHDGTIKF